MTKETKSKLLPLYAWDKETLIALITALKANTPIICKKDGAVICKSDFDRTIKEMEDALNYHGYDVKL